MTPQNCGAPGLAFETWVGSTKRRYLLSSDWLCLFRAWLSRPPSAPPTQAPTAPALRFVVVLDAAHGGDDTGAHLDSGQPEKSANLALNVRLRSLLTARGIQVITTRESDASVDLDRRAEIANHANAAVCLSLHASESGSGVHLFASSLAPAQPTRFLAWKTAQAAWITRSLALAGVAQLRAARMPASTSPSAAFLFPASTA